MKSSKGIFLGGCEGSRTVSRVILKFMEEAISEKSELKYHFNFIMITGVSAL